jgi:site-specific DNA-cytosine methylase
MNAIDLFSGPGGFSLGLRRAGFQVIANVEINRDAMDTYGLHDSRSTHFNEDIRSISFGNYRRFVDLVAGGPPCQPFSIGGCRRSNADKLSARPRLKCGLRFEVPSGLWSIAVDRGNVSCKAASKFSPDGTFSC